MAAALRDSQDTVQALLDATTETALLVDLEGRITALNETACQRLKLLSPVDVGSEPRDLIGRCVFDLFPPGLREQRKARNDEVVASGEPGRFEDERDGRWMDNRIYPIKDGRGGVTRLAVYSYDITDRKSTERELARALRAEQERARHDALTGVLNHGAIVEELQTLLTMPHPGRNHVIAVIDVDGLKAINDTYGHRVGDAVLVAVAESLKEHDAVVGRYGGDEFVAILPGAGREKGESYLEAATAALRAAQVRDEQTLAAIQVQASIGISVYPTEGAAVHALIELADTRMYAAKRQRPYARGRVAPLRAA
jgi:diguanylate cyclase (GGDEF)-like protein/PAS domain S-box-containing protein